MEISHDKFNAIIREKQKYERMKENARNVSERSSAEKQENMRLNSVNSKKKNNEFVNNLRNWLKRVNLKQKLRAKQPKIIKDLRHKKVLLLLLLLLFFVYV